LHQGEQTIAKALSSCAQQNTASNAPFDINLNNDAEKPKKHRANYGSRIMIRRSKPARVAKLVDAADLKSAGWLKPPCRFDSGLGH
jgi:hypothetical protein